MTKPNPQLIYHNIKGMAYVIHRDGGPILKCPDQDIFISDTVLEHFTPIKMPMLVHNTAYSVCTILKWFLRCPIAGNFNLLNQNSSVYLGILKL